MEVIQKILCGSSELFKDVKGFHPGDTDYIIISDAGEIFKHEHPDDNTCWFIWGKDKAMVRKYMLYFPYYMSAMSLVTKPFIDYYEFSLDEVKQAIDTYYSSYVNSTYRYYIPLFDYIKRTGSWDFPEEVLSEAYRLYQEFKKR